MVQLAVKLLGLCLSVILITNWSVSQVDVLPRKNFDPCRMNYMSNNLGYYNVVFVGSSRFGRQIDTKLFDSLHADLGFHSYNYSFDAAFSPTSINLANDLLEYNGDKPHLLILELAPIEFMGELDPSHVARSIAWYSWDDFAFLLNSRSGKSVSTIEFVRISFNRFYLFTYRIFSIGEFWKRIILSRNNCGSKQNSFEPMTELGKTPKLLQELDEIREANTTKNLTSYQLNLSSSSYLERLNQLEEKCLKRNIQLLTVIAPRMKKGDIAFLESLAKLLNQQNLIRLNSSDEYPELYSAELTADLGHLNEKGIRVFTENLSSNIRSIVRPKTTEHDERVNL